MPTARTTSARVVAGTFLIVVSSCASDGGGSPSPPVGGTPSPSVVSTPLPSIAVPEPVTMLVDTDVAADDLVAIAFLVSAPNVEIAAITVTGTGEAHCGPGADIVLRLLERLSAPDIPVACGRETPLEGSKAFPDEWREAVDNGAGLTLPTTERLAYDASAVDLIRETTTANEGLVILTLGPLTNLGDALGSEAGLGAEVESIVVMGGALYVPGNVGVVDGVENSVAEWNIFIDPRAAEMLVMSGAEPAMVSLDGTNQVPVTPAFGQRVADEASTPAAQVLADLFAANPWMTAGDYYLWDPLAAMLAAGYEVGAFSPATISLELTDGPEWGFTRPVDGEPNVTYLAEADAGLAENVLLGVLNGL